VEGRNGEERGGPGHGVGQRRWCSNGRQRPDRNVHGRRGVATSRGWLNRGGEEGADRWAVATVLGGGTG
jgi:hypothetical protein